MTDDIVVRLVKLPDGIRGYVTESPDGYLNIYLNQNLTKESMQETFNHELTHVEDCDLDGERDFLTVEGFA